MRNARRDNHHHWIAFTCVHYLSLSFCFTIFAQIMHNNLYFAFDDKPGICLVFMPVKCLNNTWVCFGIGGLLYINRGLFTLLLHLAQKSPIIANPLNLLYFNAF